MFFKDSSRIQTKANELTYLDMVYLLAVLMLGFYIVRYNLVYSLDSYNTFFIPSYLVLLLAPFGGRYLPNIQWTSLMVMIPSYLIAFLLIYLAGGLLAPGAIWLATLPIICGFLYGRTGLWLGTGLLVALTAFLGFLAFFDFEVNLIQSSQYIDQERYINIILFFIFISVNAAYFLVHEERYVSLVKSKKEESDSLLKVLMHDFATPLTILQIEGMKLNSMVGQELTSEIPLKLQRTIESMTSILVQIRELRSLAGNEQIVDFNLVDLNAALRDVVASLAPSLNHRRISMNLDISVDEAPILADERGLRDIVLHTVLANAVLSSPDDSWIDVRVYKSSHQHQKGFVLEVHDYGEPFSEEQLAAIFSIEDKVTKLSRLGELIYAFPLMKGYLEKAGASVWVKSFTADEPGRGNRLTVFFPHKD